MMSKIGKLVLQGLAAVLPVCITISILIWLFSYTEQMTRQVLLWFLPEESYFPGMGILFAILLLIAAGLLMHAYGIRYLLRLSDRLFVRIPLIKSIYGAIQDMMRVFSLAEKKELKSVVSVDVGNGNHLIGFVTGVQSGKLLFGNNENGEDVVGVYLPMSYQIGGYTVYVDKQRLTPLDISVEDAMRIVITGGAPSPRE